MIAARSPTAVGASEQPCLAPESYAAQRALRCIVADTDAAIFQKAGKRRNAREHVVHGFGNVVMRR